MEASAPRLITLRMISVLVTWLLLTYACVSETKPTFLSPTRTESPLTATLFPNPTPTELTAVPPTQTEPPLAATLYPSPTLTEIHDPTPTELTAVSPTQTEPPLAATLFPGPTLTETRDPPRGSGGDNLIANPHCDGKHTSHDISGWSQTPSKTWLISYFKNPSPTTSACKLAAPDGEGSIYQDVPFGGRNLTFGWTYINVHVIYTRVDVLCDGVIAWTPINRTKGTPDPETWVSESFATTLAQDCNMLRLSVSGAFTGTLGLKFYDASLTSS